MNDEPLKILKEELEALQKDLTARYHELQMKASGAWEQSLQVETQATLKGVKGTLSALDYSYYMQHGRGSGKFPPIQTIQHWLEQKGIQPIERKLSLSSLAFLIARKIAQEGTKRFQNNGTPAFIDQVITPERIQNIIQKIGYEYTATFQAQIINLLQNFNK